MSSAHASAPRNPLDQRHFWKYFQGDMPKKKKASPKRKTAAKKKPAKTAVSKKPPLPKGAGDELGRVVAFFRIPVVAVIKVTKGTVKVGDPLWIKGHTTDLKVTAASMQINHQTIREAKKGNEFGLKVSSRCRIGDRVYSITS